MQKNSVATGVLLMNWNEIASNLLISKLTQHNISYEELKDKLYLIGIQETANSLSIKK